MFCVLPLLALSGVSLETAANFLLFLSAAIKTGKSLSAVKTEFYFVYWQNQTPLEDEGKTLVI